MSKTFESFHLYCYNVANGTNVWSFAEIQKKVKIGNRCKIFSPTFICETVILEHKFFIRHAVMFTNDRFPQATNSYGVQSLPEEWQNISSYVTRDASIRL